MRNRTADDVSLPGRRGLDRGFVADLVDRKVDVIVTTGQREAEAVKRATASIPIVTVLPPDLGGFGLAESPARPGGNVTGLTVMENELDGKRIETLKLAVPHVRKVGVMVSRMRGDSRRASRPGSDGAPGTKQSNWDVSCLVAIEDKQTVSSRPQQAVYSARPRPRKNVAVDGNPRISARRVQPGARLQSLLTQRHRMPPMSASDFTAHSRN